MPKKVKTTAEAPRGKRRENYIKYKYKTLVRNRKRKEEWAKESLEQYGEYRCKRKEENRNYWLKKKYDITPGRYAELLFWQNGVCAICGGVNKTHTLSVDHNHKTGKVRGLLCVRCNSLLGNAKDDVSILTKAIAYLYKNK